MEAQSRTRNRSLKPTGSRDGLPPRSGFSSPWESLIRLVRYLVDYPIWHDEAFLACSLWDRDYVNLLRPLDYGQVAPWLFLAIERTIVIWLGYSELTLRLFPTICSLLSVLAVSATSQGGWYLARRRSWRSQFSRSRFT